MKLHVLYEYWAVAKPGKERLSFLKYSEDYAEYYEMDSKGWPKKKVKGK